MSPDQAARTVTITTAEGRRIAYCEYGDPAGRPVIVAHGTPGSRYQARPVGAAGRAAGIRFIAPDRPGYGQTDERAPGADRDFADWAGDVTELADHLGLERFSMVGISGGGGYALAAAARLRPRVERVVLASAILPGAPRSALRGRMRLVTLLYAACRRTPGIARAMFAGTGVFRSARRANLDAWPDADRAILADARLVAAATDDAVEGMRAGPHAAVRDLARYGRLPALPLEEITVPVVLLHGTDDATVPIGVARWADARLPESRVQPVAGAGHLFLTVDARPLIEALA